MKKGCALTLLVWVAFVALYARIAWPLVHEKMPVAIIAILGGTFAAMLFGAIVGLFTGGTDRAAFARARAAEPRKDGRMEVASGPIRPLGAPLEAPFSGRPCVAYEYDVKPPAQTSDEPTASDFAGVALCPSAIDTPRGPVKILGWALLDKFGGTPPSAIDPARAEQYLRSQQFEPLGITRILSVFSELLADDDGSIRKDFRIGTPEPSVEGKTLSEKAVAPGEVVTALGVWSEASQGFTPAKGASINRLYPGDLETVGKATGGDARRAFLTAVFFFLALHAILVPMYFLAKKHGVDVARKEARQATESVWDERNCDRLKELLAKGADPNSRNQGRTALMNAAREGKPECVEILLSAGARIEEKDDNGNTALGEAIEADREDTIAILKKAGAKDFRVTAETGRPLDPDSDALAVVKQYLAAVQAADLDTWSRLLPGGTREWLEKSREDIPFLQSIRPREVEEASGFENDEEATIVVKGPTPHGRRELRLHLRKTFEGWRITHEWFPRD